MCQGASSIFTYFFQQIANGSNAALTTCVQKNSSKGTAAPPSKLDSHRPQLSQVLLCAISSSYSSCCWVLVVVATCGEREYDVVTLVWCMGADQLMIGSDEPIGLGLVASSHNNGNCFTKCLLSTMWHNSTVFLTTLVDFVVGIFVVQELFLLLFFFPLPNRNFQGFNNVATNCY